MTGVQQLLKEMYSGYASSVGLSPEAKYMHGTPLRPVVPLDVGVGSIFILGAYPSARFALVDGVNDVPIADNLGPFESERWFDGARIREQPSARELREYFLTPLEIERSQCWITDLVKVFLFKEGHAQRYAKLNAKPPTGYERDRFIDIAKQSLTWIEREVRHAKPRLIITLGAEVAAVLRGESPTTAASKLLEPVVTPLKIGDLEVPTIHCAHPGILMRPGPNNPWPDRHREEHLPAIRRLLGERPRPKTSCA